jgi:hypothetical protein
MRVTVTFVVARVIVPSVGAGRARLVEFRRNLRRDPAVAHGVQHVLELRLVLAMDGRELVDHEVGNAPDLRVEEPHRAVLVGEVGALVRIPRHGSQLVRIAEQHDLRTAERFTRTLPRLAQAPVDCIHQVGVDHRDLIDHDRVDRAEQLAQFVGLLDLVVGDDPDRQAEQRVDGLATHVQRRHTGRGADDDLLGGVPGEVIEQGRLASTRAAGDEDVLAGRLDGIEDRLLLRGERQLVHDI